MLDIVNRIGGNLFCKQVNIDKILKFMHNSCDNPNRGRPDFAIQTLKETEGIFCMDTVVQQGLTLYSFANSIMQIAENDTCQNLNPYITHVTDEILGSL